MKLLLVIVNAHNFRHNVKKNSIEKIFGSVASIFIRRITSSSVKFSIQVPSAIVLFRVSG